MIKPILLSALLAGAFLFTGCGEDSSTEPRINFVTMINATQNTISSVIADLGTKDIASKDSRGEDIEAVRQHVVVDSVIKNSTIEEQGDKKFIRMAGSFVNIDDIHIDMIDQVNPFQKAFEILSKSVTTQVLKLIDDHIQATKIEMTEEEAIILWPKIKEWVAKTGAQPNLQSFDQKEKRMAEALVYLREQKRKKMLNE